MKFERQTCDHNTDIPMRHTCIALASLLLLAVGLVQAAPPRRPNVVWIVAENANLEFGCYGEKLVATPNVDRLAAEGVRYTRVFSTSPCLRPQPLGVHDGLLPDDDRYPSHAVASQR
jgi:hypothetical protein